MADKDRKRRLPSVAFVVTLLIGLALKLFSVVESIGGFLARPVDTSAAFGGIMQIVTFGLPFFVVAWILWVRPRLGALILILVGVVFGAWMYFGWSRPHNATDWIVRSLLVGVPIVLGVITLIWPGKPR